MLSTVKGVEPGDVDLIAPEGVVDAGDAGIRSSGNLNIAATQVLNADNISVSAPRPAYRPPRLWLRPYRRSRLCRLRDRSGEHASQETAQQSRQQAGQDETPSIISVDVLGYGGGDEGARRICVRLRIGRSNQKRDDEDEKPASQTAAPRFSPKAPSHLSMRRLIFASAALFCAGSLLASQETDYQAAVALLKKKGDPQALSQAVETLQKLAEENYAPALSTLGVFYAQGTGFPRMRREPLNYSSVLLPGFDKAQYNLGMIQLRKATLRGTRSRHEAYRAGRDQGCPPLRAVGRHLLLGDYGIATNPDKASAWVAKERSGATRLRESSRHAS